MRRAAVLYNPIAGHGGGVALADAAASVLEGAGWQVEVHATTHAGHAEALARDCAADIQRLVVAGGDGSIREAVTGLCSAGASQRVELAILPCGNANVIARELGVPLDPRRALPLIVSGERRAVDVGYANGQLFLAMAGVGWDARTVRYLARLRARRWGRAWYRLWADSAYFAAGILAALTPGGGRFRLAIQGEQLPGRYCAVIAANLRCYGKGWTMTPEASAASGRLHYQARKRAGPLFVLWQLLAAMLQRRTPKVVSDHGSGRELVVSSDRPFAVQMDGDDQGDSRELRLRVDPGGAVFLAPAAHARE